LPLPNKPHSQSIPEQLEIWGKPQRESAWRPKSEWRKNLRGTIAPVANSNAVAYAKHATST